MKKGFVSLQGILFCVILILLLSVGFLSYICFIRSSDIVFIDTSYMLNEYKGMIDARKEYKVKEDKWKQETDSLYYSIKLLMDDFEGNKKNLSKKQQDEYIRLIELKKRGLEGFQRTIQQKAEETNKEMTTEVIKEVNSFLKSYGEKHKYEMILGANDMGNIVYAREKKNITNEVLEALNKDYENKKISK